MWATARAPALSEAHISAVLHRRHVDNCGGRHLTYGMHASEPLAEFNVTVDTDDLPADLEELVADVDRPEAGFFGPGSISWRINRENALMLSGVSAILLQLGHPMVAAGVDDHSDFDADPAGRFQRTFAIVDNIVFGDLDTALEAALTVRAIHDPVVGELREDVGPFSAGDRYEANRPNLLLWVHATLLDQALVAYETYVGTLTDAEREQYYQEGKRFGRLMGIPPDRFPATLDDFYAYYERELEESVAVGERGEALKDTLFSQFRVFRPLYTFFGAATMPEPCRKAFGLPWSARRQRMFDAVAATVRRTLPLLPARIRYDDTYRASARRLGHPIGADDPPARGQPSTG